MACDHCGVLRAKIVSLRTAITLADGRAEKVERELDEARTTLRDDDGAEEILHRRCGVLRAEIARLKAELSNHCSELIDANDRTNRRDDDIASLQRQLKRERDDARAEARDQFSAAKGTVAGAEYLLAENEKLKKDASAQSWADNDRLNDMNRAYTLAKRGCEKAEAEVKRLKADKDNLCKLANRNHGIAIKMEWELDAARADVERLEAKVERREASLRYVAEAVGVDLGESGSNWAYNTRYAIIREVDRLKAGNAKLRDACHDLCPDCAERLTALALETEAGNE